MGEIATGDCHAALRRLAMTSIANSKLNAMTSIINGKLNVMTSIINGKLNAMTEFWKNKRKEIKICKRKD